MVLCSFCDQEMTNELTCGSNPVHIKAGDFDPIPYTQEPGWEDLEQNCHDCGVPPGGLHHRGCDVEACPNCFRQLINWKKTPFHSPDRWSVNHFCNPISILTLPSIFEGTTLPRLVMHDDLGWQVLDGESVEGRKPLIARVTDIADIHPMLGEFLDLPEWWEVWRTNDESTWERAPFEDEST